MKAIVYITEKLDSMQKGMLMSSLSFIHPMKVLDHDNISFVLYDVESANDVSERLDVLGEASSVDFAFRYRIV